MPDVVATELYLESLDTQALWNGHDSSIRYQDVKPGRVELILERLSDILSRIRKIAFDEGNYYIFSAELCFSDNLFRCLRVSASKVYVGWSVFR